MYEIDVGVGHWFLLPGASSERKIGKMWGHWVRDRILVKNCGGMDENVTFGLSVRVVPVPQKHLILNF